MAKTDTITINMVKDGYTYEIEKTKYDDLEEVFLYAKDNMKHPCIYHLLSHIDDPDTFKKSKRYLIRSFQRALRRQYKGLQQECPDTVLAYSIEYKLTSQKEIDGDNDTYKYGFGKTKEKLPFLHIHFYVIADCKKTRAQTFPKYAKDSLDEIKGLRAGRYFKDKDKKLYKKLKTDSDDAFTRFLYIGKVEQKSPEIPYRKAFGTSEIKKVLVAS